MSTLRACGIRWGNDPFWLLPTTQRKQQRHWVRQWSTVALTYHPKKATESFQFHWDQTLGWSIWALRFLHSRQFVSPPFGPAFLQSRNMKSHGSYIHYETTKIRIILSYIYLINFVSIHTLQNLLHFSYFFIKKI